MSMKRCGRERGGKLVVSTELGSGASKSVTLERVPD